MGSIRLGTELVHPFITAGNIVNSFGNNVQTDTFFVLCWDGSFANDRITILKPGHYLVGAQIQQIQTGSDQTTTFALLVNGVQVASATYGTDIYYEADFAANDYIQLKVLTGSQNHFGLWATELGDTLTNIRASASHYETFAGVSGTAIESATSFTVLLPTHSSGAALTTPLNNNLVVPSGDGSIYLVEADLTIGEGASADLRVGAGTTQISGGHEIGTGPVSEMLGTFADSGVKTLHCKSIFAAVMGDGTAFADGFTFLAAWGSGLGARSTGCSVSNVTLTKLVGPPCPDVISDPTALTFRAEPPTQLPVLIDDTSGSVSNGVCSGCALPAGNYHVKFALWDGASGYTNIVDWVFTANGTDWYEKDWSSPIGHPNLGRAWVSYNGGPFQHLTDASFNAYRTGVYLDSTVAYDGVALPTVVENVTTLGGTNPASQTLEITSVPNSSFAVTTDQPWLSAVAGSGTTPDTVTVDIDVTQTVGAGPFTGNVIITPLCCPPLQIPVTLSFGQPRGLGCDLPRNRNAFLLIEKSPQSNQTYQMKAVNYDDNYYEHDGDFDLTGTGGFVTGGSGDESSFGFGTSFGVFGG